METSRRSVCRWAPIFAAAWAVSLPGLARADTPIVQFTPGDYLIMRGGDPANPNNQTSPDFGGEVNAYIDEYSQSGYYVGTLALPQMTLPGANASSHEGNLNLSPNGQWIAFAGYDPIQNPAGPTPHNTDGTENAVIGEVNLLAGPSSLNASTQIPGSNNYPNSLTGQYVHSALTLDGNEFYIGAKYNETAGGNLQANDTGLLYVNGTGTSATATVLEGGTDWRNILDFNGQLYGATGSSSVGTHGVYAIGTGLPASNNPLPPHAEITNYPGGQSSSSFGFVDIQTTDVSAGVSNGFNVLYTVGDQSAAGITKYYYDPATQVWNYAGNQATLTSANNINNPYDIVASVDPTNPAWVDITVSGENGIYSYIDKSGDPQAPIANNSFTQLIAPPSYASFYGMTQDPGPINLVWGNSGNGQTWDVAANSNWTYAGSSIKFANQENVTFDDTSNNTQPILLNSLVQPGSVTVNASRNNYTISGSGSIGGSGVLRLLPGNTSIFTLDISNSYTGGTTIDGGTLVIGVAGALPTGGNVVNNGAMTVQVNTIAGNVSGTGTLNISSSALLKLAPSSGPDSLGAVNLSGTASLDITNNALSINYPATDDPAGMIRGYLQTGYNGDKWNGPGIVSSNAAANPGLYAVGYADGNTDAGTPAAANQILIKNTIAGDANLDGLVNFSDLLVVAQDYGRTGQDWAHGDFNYDGLVNFSDLLLVAQNYGKQLSAGQLAELPGSFSAQWNLVQAEVKAGESNNVPEPGTVSLLVLGGIGLLRRRRK